MSFTSIFPYEILIHIYEYNPEHREKMKWVLEDIRNTQYCEVCDKMCIKYIYSRRRCGMICCSMECVDNMQ
jgi:hypothetical protein